MIQRATASGAYVIADVTDPSFYPGKALPSSYQDPTFTGTWFFWPRSWLEENFGGVFSAWVMGYPMIYTPGFASAEEALAAAEKWEADQPERERDWAMMQSSVTNAVSFKM